MKKLTWWFRIVGALILLFSLMELAFMFNPEEFTGYPYPPSALVTRAFIDALLPFYLGGLGVGTFLLWASRDPLRNLNVVWLVVLLQALQGVVSYLILVARGWDVASLGDLMAFSLVVIVTGILFARLAPRASAAASVPNVP